MDNRAYGTEASPYDIGYFTDADQLTPPGEPFVPGVHASRLPPSKRDFCTRTHEQVAEPFRQDADQFASLSLQSDAIEHRREAMFQCYGGVPHDSAALIQYSNLLHQLSTILDQQWSHDESRRSFHDTLAFANPPGSFNTGLCWFHSRFQRASLYLAHYRPDLPKPTPYEAKQLIRDLIRMDQVVEIPGFRDLNEFSKAYTNEIREALDQWSVVTAPRMLVRVGDRTRQQDPGEVRRTLETLYHRVQDRSDIQFVRFNTGEDPLGFHSHGYLVLQAEPVFESSPDLPALPGGLPRLVGYRFLVVDSNTPKTPQWKTERFEASSDPLSISYVDYDDDLVSMHQALRDYCR